MLFRSTAHLIVQTCPFSFNQPELVLTVLEHKNIGGNCVFLQQGHVNHRIIQRNSAAYVTILIAMAWLFTGLFYFVRCQSCAVCTDNIPV